MFVQPVLTLRQFRLRHWCRWPQRHLRGSISDLADRLPIHDFAAVNHIVEGSNANKCGSPVHFPRQNDLIVYCRLLKNTGATSAAAMG
jgi:hypothetical protein